MTAGPELKPTDQTAGNTDREIDPALGTVAPTSSASTASVPVRTSPRHRRAVSSTSRRDGDPADAGHTRVLDLVGRAPASTTAVTVNLTVTDATAATRVTT